MFLFNYPKICQALLGILPQKQKQVVERRFGLGGGRERETLQKIGDDLGITRERVRQVERDALLKLQTAGRESDLEPVYTHFARAINEKGGVRREDILLKELGGDDFQNYIYFLLTLRDTFHRFPEAEDVFTFWALEKGLFQRIKEIISGIIEEFVNSNKPLSVDDIFSLTKKEPQPLVLSSLEIAKKIEQGPLGFFGLVAWSEIKPRGVRDAAFLALKKIGKPLHFREITRVAAELPGEFFQQRNILPQTVHNELIRDERFVLVGRGIYGLKEWGYVPGTVRDVITDILKTKKEPLSKEEILKEVQKQRLVKANTILLNLSDKSRFLKDDSGRYVLKHL